LGTTTTKRRRKKLVSQRQVARDLGVTVRAIQDAVDRGMPRHRNGRGWSYHTPECRRWYRARQRAAEAGRAKKREPRTELDRARLRKARAIAARSERALDELRRSVLTPSDEAALMAESRDVLREAAKPVPRAWATRFVGVDDLPEAGQRLLDFRDALLEALRGAAGEGNPVPEPIPARTPPTTLSETRARRWNADAEVIELRARLEAGELVSLDDAEQRVAEVLTHLRASVLSIPGRYAHELVGLTKSAAERALAAAVEGALVCLDATASDD
jgi:phage terminase Nu1 subunit (DNA packaging protein)